MSDPIWSPGPVRRQTANIRRFMEQIREELDPGIRDYHDLHRYSVEHPVEFWHTLWEFCEVVGYPGTTVVSDFDRMPGASWFPAARLNFAENLLRYRDDQTAIIFRS
jgi:acetoacetyl-CoA synthetase